jgi:hypothetical protein
MHVNVPRHIDTRARASCACSLLVCALTLGAWTFGGSHAGAHVGTSGRPVVVAPRAKASGREDVDSTLNFEITQIKGNVVHAVGKSLGTFVGSASLNLTLVNASHAIAQIYAYNSRGALRGVDSSRYHASGAISYFSGGGAPPAIHGSGKYAGVKIVSMSLSGFMNRRTLQISVRMQGVWDV